MVTRSRKSVVTFIVLLIYGVLALFMTWPLIAQLGSAIPGKLGDTYAHLWTYSWLKTAIQSGQSPYLTDLLYFPEGANLLNHNIAWFHAAVWLPLQLFLDQGTSYSLVHWLAFPLNGFALFLLAREHTRSDLSAFVGGLVAAFWPYNLSHFDHPNLILICWLPLALLFIRRTIINRRKLDAVLAGLFVALLGITRWQLLFMASIMIVLYAIYMLIINRQELRLATFMLLAVSAVVAMILMLPLLYPMLDYQLNRVDVSEVLVHEEEPYGTDLAAYIMPNRYHPLWGHAIAVASRPFSGNNIYTRSIGYGVLILAALGLLKRFRETWFWLLTALVYLIMSLGPQLYVWGKPYFSLPYKLMEDLIVMQLVRFPDRYNVMLSIPAAMLAAYGAYVLVGKAARRQALIRTAVISSIILIEYASAFSMLPLHTPKWYESLAEEPGQFGILDIPINIESFDTYYNYYQLTHGKPLVMGHVSRPSAKMFEFIANNSFLQAIYGEKSPPEQSNDFRNQLRSLRLADVHYIVLHKHLLDDKQQQAWKDWLVLPPVSEDEDIIVFSTERSQLGTEVPWEQIAYTSPDNKTTVGLVRSNILYQDITAGNWLDVDVVWGTSSPVGRPLQACLQLLAVAGEVVAEDCAELVKGYPADQWQENDLVHARHLLELSPFMEGGTYTAALSLTLDGQQRGQTLAVGDIEVHPLPREFVMPEVPNPVTAVWGDAVALAGYEKNVASDKLELKMYWRALHRMDDSYKMFIHLINSENGEIVTQVDSVPRNWSYPTNWWEQGEIVEDNISLSLEGVSQGDYDLLIGLYDPSTNERLTLDYYDGTLGSDDVFLIESVLDDFAGDH